MRQLTLFGTTSGEDIKKDPQHWKLFVDGASRNNPGPSGAGIYILKDSQFFEEYGFYLGKKTNNQAEYLALLIGLCLLKKKVATGDSVHIISDSLLLVQQLKGAYKVKNAELKPLHTLASSWMHELNADIFHVLRLDNVNADNMANQGIDKKIKVPLEIAKVLNQHAISI